MQDLLPGKSTADVSGVWKEPTSNVQQITISPPEISSSYQFPAGTTKVTWTASNAVGSENCSIYVIINGKLFLFAPFNFDIFCLCVYKDRFRRNDFWLQLYATCSCRVCNTNRVF